MPKPTPAEIDAALKRQAEAVAAVNRYLEMKEEIQQLRDQIKDAVAAARAACKDAEAAARAACKAAKLGYWFTLGRMEAERAAAAERDGKGTDSADAD